MTSDSFSVVHTIDSLHPAAGGPSRTVVQLTDALAAETGAKITLVSQGLVGACTIPSRSSAVSRVLIETSSALRLGLGLPLRCGLEEATASHKPSLIHNHGLWKPSNHWAAKMASSLDVPLITHPRGMLEPWALQHRAWKKRFAMLAYQRRDLEQVAALVATSLVEYENIRRLGFRQPIAVIPNGVDLELRGLAPGPKLRDGAHTFLFIGRIHPVKGLLNLVRAWAQVTRKGWQLLIVGPDEGGHLREVLAEVARLGLAESVQYRPAVDGAAKTEMYRRADLLVLPSFTENFGVVVAEALAHGVPAIATRGTPWSDLSQYGCGWWVPGSVEAIAAAMRDAMALSDTEREEMGNRGRDYVRRFGWASIARQMAGLYSWVLGQGDRPDWVQAT